MSLEAKEKSCVFICPQSGTCTNKTSLFVHDPLWEQMKTHNFIYVFRHVRLLGTSEYVMRICQYIYVSKNSENSENNAQAFFAFSGPVGCQLIPNFQMAALSITRLQLGPDRGEKKFIGFSASRIPNSCKKNFFRNLTTESMRFLSWYPYYVILCRTYKINAFWGLLSVFDPLWHGVKEKNRLLLDQPNCIVCMLYNKIILIRLICIVYHTC